MRLTGLERFGIVDASLLRGVNSSTDEIRRAALRSGAGLREAEADENGPPIRLICHKILSNPYRIRYFLGVLSGIKPECAAKSRDGEEVTSAMAKSEASAVHECACRGRPERDRPCQAVWRAGCLHQRR